jgi:hypothetical protein
MRKLLLAVLVCSLVTSQPLKAQYYYYNNKYYENAMVFELGVTAGVMNSLTDLGGKKGIGKNFIKDLNWKNTKPCVGAYIMGVYQNKLAFRLQGTFGSVKGYDSILKPVAATTSGRYERNLSFKSKITDFQLGVEIHPLMFKNYDDNEEPFVSPYIMVGIGYYSFDPQANLKGQWYSLQPLRLEGQGFAEYPDRHPYKLSQINFAAGLGIKYEINDIFNLRFEVEHRFLTTDYLDDASTDYIDPNLFYNYLPASQAAIAQQLYNRKAELNPGDMLVPGEQRGDPKDKDAFFSIQLKLGMSLGRIRR